MTPKDDPMWKKMVAPTLDTLEEAISEMKAMEAKEKEARIKSVSCTDLKQGTIDRAGVLKNIIIAEKGRVFSLAASLVRTHTE